MSSRARRRHRHSRHVNDDSWDDDSWERVQRQHKRGLDSHHRKGTHHPSQSPRDERYERSSRRERRRPRDAAPPRNRERSIYEPKRRDKYYSHRRHRHISPGRSSRKAEEWYYSPARRKTEPRLRDDARGGHRRRNRVYESLSSSSSSYLSSSRSYSRSYSSSSSSLSRSYSSESSSLPPSRRGRQREAPVPSSISSSSSVSEAANLEVYSREGSSDKSDSATLSEVRAAQNIDDDSRRHSDHEVLPATNVSIQNTREGYQQKIPDFLLKRLIAIVAHSPQISEIPILYQQQYGEKLDYTQFGYKRLSSLLIASGCFEVEVHRGKKLTFLKNPNDAAQLPLVAEPLLSEANVRLSSGNVLADFKGRIREIHMVYPVLDLICPGCGWLAHDPHLLSCGHYYCGTCIRKASKPSARRFQCQKCSNDSNLIINIQEDTEDTEAVRQAKRRIRSFIGLLMLVCPYLPKCTWRGTLADYPKHRFICTQDPENADYKKKQIHNEAFSEEDMPLTYRDREPNSPETEAEILRKTEECTAQFKDLTNRLLSLLNGGDNATRSSTRFPPVSTDEGRVDESEIEEGEDRVSYKQTVQVGFDPSQDLSFNGSESSEEIKSIIESLLPLEAGSIVEVVPHPQNSVFGFCAGCQDNKVGWFPTACIKRPDESRLEFIIRLKEMDWQNEQASSSEVKIIYSVEDNNASQSSKHST